MNKPYFSIVIPTYNRGNLIGRCIDSIISQTYTNWEAIIVDNYSEDNTEEIVMSYNDERIRFIKNHNNGVIAVSRNKALDMAKGDWICFLDSDDAWLPNKLEMVIPYTNDYDLIYHGYRKNIKRTSIFQHMNWMAYEIKDTSVGYVMQRGDPINPSCTCVSKEIIGSIRFDESKELFAVEDYDFFLQLLNKKISVKYLKRALTLYDMSGCSQVKEATDRDMVVFEKWKHVLSETEKEEFMLEIKYREACYKRSIKEYKNAAHLYKAALRSKILEKKIKALKGYIVCMLKVLL